MPADTPPTFSRNADGSFSLKTSLWLPRRLSDLFPFFSDAYNLQEITPPWVHVHIVTPRPIDMRAGCLIRYRLKLRGIPVSWTTKITLWNPPHAFIDEQLQGPYRLWKHHHTFEEKDGGTLMRDTVDYAMFGGALANRLFVQPQLHQLFTFRQEKLQQLFA